MNAFIAANRTHSHTDWTTIWLFCTRMFGIPATVCIVAVVAMAMVGFTMYLKGFPSGMKTWVKIVVAIVVEILAIVFSLAGYWMTLYAYGVI